MSEMMCYVAKCKGCGAVLAAVLDYEPLVSECAKDIARWIRDGLVVEHVPSSAAKAFSECSCKKEPPQQPGLFAEVTHD